MTVRTTTSPLSLASGTPGAATPRVHVGRRAVIPLAVLFLILSLGVSRVRDPWAILIIFAAFHLLGIAAAILSGLHAWRALATPRPAARLVILVAGAAMTGSIAFSATSLLPDLVHLADDDPAWPDSHVAIAPGGQVIEITGPLRWSVVGRVQQALEATPGARVIRLDSPGGRITVGLELHEIIRARGLDTLVTANCASACTDAFLAGRRRWAGPKARLGFHQGGTSSGGVHAVDTTMARLYEESGIAPAFLDRIQSVPPGTLWLPTLDEMQQARVITDMATPGHGPLTAR